MSKKRSVQDYWNTLKSIRKYLPFNYKKSDLKRKGIRATITRAANEVAAIKRSGLTIVPVKRNPRESTARYKRRLKRARDQTSEKASLVKGIAIRVPEGTTAKVSKTGTIRLRNEKTKTTEQYYEIPRNIWAMDEEQKKEVLAEILKDMKRNRERWVQYAHSENRGRTATLNLPQLGIDDIASEAAQQLDIWGMKYKPKKLKYIATAFVGSNRKPSQKRLKGAKRK